jgi:uncharacterized protein YggU (UPF0235/DUF167 family)
MQETELPLRVTPRAKRNELSLGPDGGLVAHVTAAPVAGQANKAVILLVAKVLGVAKSRVHITAGETSRNKRVRIEGLSGEEIRAILT